MSYDVNILLKTLNHQAKKKEAIYCMIASSFKLSESAFWILYTLAGTEQVCSQQEISEELSISKQTIHSSIHSLVRRGYLFLEQSSISTRRKNVLLTAKGMRFVERYIVPLQEAERIALLKMDSSDQQRYVALSQTFTANLQEEIEKHFTIT